MPQYDFANILFAGPCNRFCPWCIGKELPRGVNVDNLDVYPPRGIEAFIERVNEHEIRQVVFTGTVTDPQLYRHEAALLALLRARLHGRALISLHTNGVLALKKMNVFNSYDRACVSFPSFVPATYEKLMGSRTVPDLARIVRAAKIPVKVSCVINEHNVEEILDFLASCHAIGIRRLVFRRLHGDPVRWPILDDEIGRGDAKITRTFRGNPVFDYQGMEVTVWDFDASECESINLFADGTLGTSYLLTDTPEIFSRLTPQRSVLAKRLAEP